MCEKQYVLNISYMVVYILSIFDYLMMAIYRQLMLPGVLSTDYDVHYVIRYVPLRYRKLLNTVKLKIRDYTLFSTYMYYK